MLISGHSLLNDITSVPQQASLMLFDPLYKLDTPGLEGSESHLMSRCKVPGTPMAKGIKA